MRLILHAGLHKSGTTSIQRTFRSAFGVPTDGVWFPIMDSPAHGHELIAWTVRDIFAERVGTDSAVQPVELSSLISQAKAHGVGCLIISSEAFDVVDDHAMAALRHEIGSIPTTVVLTVTAPIHRWYSMWQERIKHGHSTRPLDAPDELAIVSFTASGALRRLVERFAFGDIVIRLVRTSPYEPDLARSVLAVCGVDAPNPVDEGPPANTGIGVDVELLRRLNALGMTNGLLSPRSIEVFSAFKKLIPRRDREVERCGAYGVPHWLGSASQVEQRWLQGLREPWCDSRMTLHDPHHLLARWVDQTTPDWVDDLAHSDWPEVPDCSAW